MFTLLGKTLLLELLLPAIYVPSALQVADHMFTWSSYQAWSPASIALKLMAGVIRQSTSQQQLKDVYECVGYFRNYVDVGLF